MLNTQGSAINYPEWTDSRKKNGLDPLGMQNSSVSLYQTFLPGISNVTLRMRYYGLYAWLCRTYAQKDGDTNPESWKRVIRRAEALYALIAYREGTETGIPAAGVAGIDWAQKTLDKVTGDIIEFATAAEPGSETYYLKQPWGVFGLAYRSQLFEIGVFDRSKDHEIPIPSKRGDDLATAFENSIGDCGELFYSIVQCGSVTKAELDRLSLLGASEISLQSGERTHYQDLLLAPTDEKDVNARARRLSVLLILKITALLGRDPKAEEVRWILFAGCDQKSHPLALGSPDLDAQRQLWWVYHANDLSHIALETLLKFTLDTLAEYPGGITLSRLISLCVDRILEAADNTPPEDWVTLLDSIELAANAYASDANSEWSLSDQIMKRAGRSDARVCPAEIAWIAVRLLATLHKRVRDGSRDIASVLGVFNPDAFRSLLTETRFLERHAQEPLADMLARLIEERVVQRHLFVAMQKLRHGDYTFLIETDEGKLRLREKDGPVFTNPRLGPAITFLKDIHLVGAQGLTDYGAAAAGVL